MLHKLSSEFTVENHVPLPGYRAAGGPPLKYPWPTMEVGSSFEVAAAADARRRKSQALSVIAAAWGKRQTPRRKFTIRTTDAGVRIWRVE